MRMTPGEVTHAAISISKMRMPPKDFEKDMMKRRMEKRAEVEEKLDKMKSEL